MRNLIIRLVINAVALGVAAWAIDGINYGGVTDLLLVALIFGLVNALVKPVVSFLTCPLVALTLGLFIIVINALMLWLTGSVARLLGLDFSVTGFLPALWGSLIVSVVSIVLNVVLPEDKK